MRCDYCPLGSDEDVCPEAENEYGIEHKDGVLGCKHPRNWVEKRDKEYSNYLGDMGLDMGIEMSNSKPEIGRIVEICKHTIGLDYHKPYHRHGKAFYKPYRNFFCTTEDDVMWNKLCSVGIAKRSEKRNGCVDFYLTQVGIKWLGRQLKITIKGTGLE
nr:MAG TPA: hypothetical protein [Caudoviricetes sp.]